MPQCQLRVFCCFSFQKSYTVNILGIAQAKNTRCYFTVTYTKSQGEKEWSHEASTPPGGAAPPLATRGHGVGPRAPLTIVLKPIYTP